MRFALIMYGGYSNNEGINNMVIIERCQKSHSNRAINPVDITRKSADDKTALKLAPEWDWIMGVKNGTMNYKEYIQLYLEKLTELDEQIADWLEAKAGPEKTATLVCYCPDDNVECHTYLAALFFVNRWPPRFQAGESI